MLMLSTGLGAMGYPMAVNLRRKLPKSAKVVIAELNQDTVHRYLEETRDAGPVEVASTPREVSERSVCLSKSYYSGPSLTRVFLAGYCHHHVTCWYPRVESLQ